MNHDALKAALARLAHNYQWTWNTSCRLLLEDLPGSTPSQHPMETVLGLSREVLARLTSDRAFISRVESELEQLDSLRTRLPDPKIAYCSPEFGLASVLPQYAGGLGVLAGDHLKTASDLELDLVGVGLFYREGVFRQRIEDGQQVEGYELLDPLKVGGIDTDLVVEIPFPGRNVSARVWRFDVGRVPLILLDTNLETNNEHDRAITDRLYDGSREHRLEQEWVLGVGGAIALDSLGWAVEVHHLNEGHAGFITFPLIDRTIENSSLTTAIDEVRKGLVFTTHTPVPAGIDRFDRHIVEPYLQIWADKWALGIDEVWAMGQDPDEDSKFNMAALCLRTSRTANGVSLLHGEVSRKLFAGVGIGDDIISVTNGVHARTWTADHVEHVFDDRLGPTWDTGDPGAWEAVSGIDDALLSSIRLQSSQQLTEMVRDQTGSEIDPDTLFVGFARRFAPYKRANLILRNPDLLEELVSDTHRPVHFVFAGKAHPTDDNGKRLVAELVEATKNGPAAGHVTFLPDYNMRSARTLVQGVDVWLNNPIRPREASGTSGEKAVLNGVLNASIRDGWWDEMYDGSNGWEIVRSELEDAEDRDVEESQSVLTTLLSIANEYHDTHAIFLGRIRHAWRTLGPRVVSARMLREYQADIYKI